MNTSLVSFEELQRSFPSEAESIERLEELFLRPSTLSHPYTFKRIFDYARPRSHKALAAILRELVKRNVVTQAYVLTSDDGVALAKFEQYRQLPPTWFDDESESEIEVSQDNVEVRYGTIHQ